MGVRVRVGLKDRVGVQSGQKSPSGGFGAHGASGAKKSGTLSTMCQIAAAGDALRPEGQGEIGAVCYTLTNGGGGVLPPGGVL